MLPEAERCAEDKCRHPASDKHQKANPAFLGQPDSAISAYAPAVFDRRDGEKHHHRETEN
jgi:hypothetical protein